jgi:RNA polymerase sigma factor (sigma-70 family)
MPVPKTLNKISLVSVTISINQPEADSLTKPSDLDWQTILPQHDRWLRTIVFARLRDRDAVEEVMQEVALAAVRQAAPIQDVNKVAPWLYRLAIHQVLLYRRKMGRRRKLLNRYVTRSPADGDSADADPLAWLLADERRGLIRKALEKLPERDADILILKYTEDWSYHQIAKQLGVSHSAVEARLHRARKKLREELAASQVIEVKK